MRLRTRHLALQSYPHDFLKRQIAWTCAAVMPSVS
jgi:hypothetical protein